MTQSIDRIIDELEELCESSGKVLGRRNKVMVDLDKFMYLVSELRTQMPDQMLEANEVIRQKESIINQAYLESKRLRDNANQESQAITAAAQNEHESMVSESEILRDAHERAGEISDEAHRKAEEIMRESRQESERLLATAHSAAAERREGADQYSREVLFSIEERLSHMLGQIRRGIDALGADAEAMAAARKVAQTAGTNGSSAS